MEKQNSESTKESLFYLTAFDFETTDKMCDQYNIKNRRLYELTGTKTIGLASKTPLTRIHQVPSFEIYTRCFTKEKITLNHQTGLYEFTSFEVDILKKFSRFIRVLLNMDFEGYDIADFELLDPDQYIYICNKKTPNIPDFFSMLKPIWRRDQHLEDKYRPYPFFKGMIYERPSSDKTPNQKYKINYWSEQVCTNFENKVFIMSHRKFKQVDNFDVFFTIPTHHQNWSGLRAEKNTQENIFSKYIARNSLNYDNTCDFEYQSPDFDKPPVVGRHIEQFNLSRLKGDRLDLRKPMHVVRQTKESGAGWIVNEESSVQNKEEQYNLCENIRILPICQEILQMCVRLPTIKHRIKIYENAHYVYKNLCCARGNSAKALMNESDSGATGFGNVYKFKLLNKENPWMIPPIGHLRISNTVISGIPNHDRIVHALTRESAQEIYSYETMELFGDALLHLAVTFDVLYHVKDFSDQSELRKLSSERSARERNTFLHKKSNDVIRLTEKHLVEKDFLAFRSSVQRRAKETDRQKINADVVEALIGMASKPEKLFTDRLSKKHNSFNECYDRAEKLLTSLNIIAASFEQHKARLFEYADYLAKVWPTEIFKEKNATPDYIFEQMKLEKIVRKRLSAKIETTKKSSNDENNNVKQKGPVFKFKRKELLIAAFIPQSLSRDFNYETLEWIGDTIIKFLVFCYLFSYTRDTYELTPDFKNLDQLGARITEGKMTMITQFLLENVSFNDVMHDTKLSHYLDKLLELTKFGAQVTVKKESKTYADSFEAIVAAVFIENDCDLDVCWTVFKPYILTIVKNERSDGRKFVGKDGEDIFTLLEYLEGACDRLFTGVKEDIEKM